MSEPTTASTNLQPTLTGDLVELRPLQPEDWDAVFAAASDPLIWEQHPVSDRYKEDIFRVFFTDALATGSAFVVINRATGEIIGSTRYHGHDAAESEIEIGWTFIARRYWGGRYNGEMKRLMLEHAFKFVDNVVLFVGEDNVRSRKAVERIGGKLGGGLVRTDESGRQWPHVKYRIKKQEWATSL